MSTIRAKTSAGFGIPNVRPSPKSLSASGSPAISPAPGLAENDPGDQCAAAQCRDERGDADPGHQESIEQATGQTHQHRGQQAVADGFRAHDDGCGADRRTHPDGTEGQVERASHDDHQHSARQDTDDRALLEHSQQVVGASEERRTDQQNGEDEEEDHLDAEPGTEVSDLPHPLALTARRDYGGSVRRCDRRFGDGRRDGRHCPDPLTARRLRRAVLGRRCSAPRWHDPAS